MTDYATFKALPASERDALGFAEYQRRQRIGTHGPECHTWGPRHYECLLRAYAAREAQATKDAEDAEDARRLDWLTFNIGGKALRDIGVIWSEHGDARRAIDAARAQQEER